MEDRGEPRFRAVAADTDPLHPYLRVVAPNMREITVVPMIVDDRVHIQIDSFEEASRIQVYLGSHELWKEPK